MCNKLRFINLEKFIGPVDIYHSSDWLQFPSQAKKITTIHDLVILKYPDYSHPYIIQTQRQRLQWVKAECDRVIADSFATKDDIVQLLSIGSEKIKVIYPGINRLFNKSTKLQIEQIRKKYNLNNDYILTIGSNIPRKNLKLTLEAFRIYYRHSLISARKKKIDLVIIGQQSWPDNLLLSSNIKYLGFVEQNDLPILYSSAIFLVYVSLYEGFGFPILEALSCGCPVITSTRGSLKEVGGNCALFVDPYDAQNIAANMTKLTNDESLRTSLLKNSQNHVAKFSWLRATEQLLDLYHDLKNKKL